MRRGATSGRWAAPELPTHKGRRLEAELFNKPQLESADLLALAKLQGSWREGFTAVCAGDEEGRRRTARRGGWELRAVDMGFKIEGPQLGLTGLVAVSPDGSSKVTCELAESV